MAGSTAMTVFGQLKKGKAEKRVAYDEAAQLENNAVAAYASGTRQAYEHAREGRIAASDARAAMASSGGTTTDYQATRQLAKTKDTASYNSLASLFEAKVESNNLRKQADTRRKEGDRAKREAKWSAVSTVLRSATNAAGMYWKPKAA